MLLEKWEYPGCGSWPFPGDFCRLGAPFAAWELSTEGSSTEEFRWLFGMRFPWTCPTLQDLVLSLPSVPPVTSVPQSQGKGKLSLKIKHK